MPKRMKTNPALIGSGILLIISVVLGYGWYSTQEALTKATGELDLQTRAANSFAENLQSAEQDVAQLQEALEQEKERNDSFEDQIKAIGGTVGKLDKLSRTDPELLQKYSKVYFLNENYVPAALTKIPENYTFGSEEEYLSAEIWPFLKDLQDEAKEDDVELLVISGYRSFGKQAALKASYRVTYGSGANTFSADQGYSEHQLGTTIDFTTRAVGSSFVGFDETEAFKWLEDNAYKYGFILSYPSGNSYYQYEPWHWRFVGKELARDLRKDSKDFYDLDQRSLDPYLINFYD